MTQDGIIWQNEVLEMARQAGFEEQFTRPQDAIVRKGIALSGEFKGYKVNNAVLETFAKLVAAKEREACADLVENFDYQDKSGNDVFFLLPHEHVAKAIRARGEA